MQGANIPLLMTGHYITVITVAKVDAAEKKAIRKFILYIYKYIYNIIYITIPSLDTGWRKQIVSNCNDCNVMGMLQDPVQYYPDSEIKKRHPFPDHHQSAAPGHRTDVEDVRRAVGMKGRRCAKAPRTAWSRSIRRTPWAESRRR